MMASTGTNGGDVRQGTNKQPRTLWWLRALLRNPWAPLPASVTREMQATAFKTRTGR